MAKVRRRRGSGARALTNCRTCAATFTLVVIQASYVLHPCLAFLIITNRLHGLGIGHDLQALDNSFHPVAGNKESHRPAMAGNGERAFFLGSAHATWGLS